jgi:dolichyl-phosphate-mannose--protein O-mannosyl transferase
LTAITLGIGSLIFFVTGIANPPGVLFDEPLYVDAARSLHSGGSDPSPYGPPLGKLLVTVGLRLFGDNAFGWRAGSAVFGALTLAGIFLFVKLLLGDHTLALVAAVIALSNNFLYVFSRTAMMDVYLMAFAVWGMIAFLAVLELPQLGPLRRRTLMACGGILLGLAGACKWNAVDELGVVIVMGLTLFFLAGKSTDQGIIQAGEHIREAGPQWFAFSYLVLPLASYFLTFWPLCRLLNVPFSVHKLISMNAFIWHFHTALVKGNDTLISAWYTWPFETRPLRNLSYLVGNWYVMWVGFIALLFSVRRFARNLPETLIVLLYFANLLQWAFTPQSCLYYYYYFPAAMFLGIAIPVALHRLPPRLYDTRLSIVSVIPAACVFLYCFSKMAHLPAPYDCMFGCWH